jgi:hypothetical protein
MGIWNEERGIGIGGGGGGGVTIAEKGDSVEYLSR